MNNSAVSAYTALCLKFVGVILIVSSLLDYLVLLFPFQADNATWQANVVARIVDAGIIPMMGIALLLLAYWLESVVSGGKSTGFDLRPISLWLAAILGAVFLLCIPFYGMKVSQETSKQIAQVEERGEQAATQIQSQSDRLNQALANPNQLKQQIQQIDQVISSGEFQGRQLNEQNLQQAQAQKELFENFINDPDAAKERVAQRIEQLETQVGSRKEDAIGNIKTNATKSMLKTCLSSFLLTIGYMAISWTGLRGASK